MDLRVETLLLLTAHLGLKEVSSQVGVLENIFPLLFSLTPGQTDLYRWCPKKIHYLVTLTVVLKFFNRPGVAGAVL